MPLTIQTFVLNFLLTYIHQPPYAHTLYLISILLNCGVMKIICFSFPSSSVFPLVKCLLGVLFLTHWLQQTGLRHIFDYTTYLTTPQTLEHHKYDYIGDMTKPHIWLHHRHNNTTDMTTLQTWLHHIYDYTTNTTKP